MRDNGYASTFERQKFYVRVQTYAQQPFDVQCETQEQADYIRKAVNCYQNYDNVVMHMGSALRSIEEMKP